MAYDDTRNLVQPLLPSPSRQLDLVSCRIAEAYWEEHRKPDCKFADAVEAEGVEIGTGNPEKVVLGTLDGSHVVDGCVKRDGSAETSSVAQLRSAEVDSEGETHEKDTARSPS